MQRRYIPMRNTSRSAYNLVNSIYLYDIEYNMKDIIVLTKENCPMCKRLKKEFDRHGIIYQSVDVESDLDGMAYVHYYGLTGSILPRVIINECLLPAYDTLNETLDVVLKSINGSSFKGIECAI